MCITQTQKVEECLRALLPNNPFVPPKGDVCFINNLPFELLSRIFEVGLADEDEGDMAGDCWDNLSYHLDAKDFPIASVSDCCFPCLPLLAQCITLNSISVDGYYGLSGRTPTVRVRIDAAGAE